MKPGTSPRSRLRQQAVLEGGRERNFLKFQSLYGEGVLGIFPSPIAYIEGDSLFKGGELKIWQALANQSISKKGVEVIRAMYKDVVR